MESNSKMSKKTIAPVLIMATAALAIAHPARAQQWGYPAELERFLTPVPDSGFTLKPVLTNAKEIDLRAPKKAALAETPWSSDFWPDVRGSIADPYNETGEGFWFTQNKRVVWRTDGPRAGVGVKIIGNTLTPENRSNIVKRFDGIQKKLATDPASVSQKDIDNMSPAEKYDMLLGDKDFTFTRSVVKMVDDRDANSLVNPGAGICHGWSPASLNSPRPEHSFTVNTPFGRQVTFYPDDVKALTAYMWGKTPARPTFMSSGFKCQTGGHQDAHGRSVDPRCFNSNPAFVYLMAINQIGLNGRGFAIDKSFNEGVWNHPVYAYEVKYWNVADPKPYTGQSYKEAKVGYIEKTGQYLIDGGYKKSDAYAQYRSPGTKAILGVSLTLHFGIENRYPGHKETDSAKNDKTDDQRLMFDLELDENDKIIGGEWREYEDGFKPTVDETHGYTHPSVVWMPPAGTQPWSPGDLAVESVEWDPAKSLAPASYLQAARVADAYAENEMIKGKEVSLPVPTPLMKVVNKLISLSRTKR